jgi:hypothetical protein
MYCPQAAETQEQPATRPDYHLPSPRAVTREGQNKKIGVMGEYDLNGL